MERRGQHRMRVLRCNMVTGSRNLVQSVLLVVIVMVKLTSSIDLVINKSDLKSHLSSWTYTRCHLYPEYKESAREYIRAFVSDLQTRNLKPIVIQEQPFQSHQILYDNGTMVTGINMIYMLKGTNYGTTEDKPVVLGAHYDTHPNTTGVDDNGSGLAALLETMRLVLEADTIVGKYTVIFVAFDMTEYDTLGSKVFLHYFLVPQVLQLAGILPENFQGAIILDSLMNYDDKEGSQEIPYPNFFSQFFKDIYEKISSNYMRGDFLMAAGRRDEEHLAGHFLGLWEKTTEKGPSQQYKAYNLGVPVTGRLGATVPSIIDFIKRAYDSDFINFWEFENEFTDDGLKALFLTDTGHFRGVMKDCRQKYCDDQRMLTDSNLEFLLVTVKVLAQILIDRSVGLPQVYRLLEQKAGKDVTDPEKIAQNEVLMLKPSSKIPSGAEPVRTCIQWRLFIVLLCWISSF